MVEKLVVLFRVRDLKTNRIGKLMSISGTITRSSEIRPELIEATFLCLVCNTEVRGIKQQFKYTEVQLNSLFLV